MNKTVIEWHNVQNDGFPKESGEYLVHFGFQRYVDRHFSCLPFSAKHNSFNVFDNFSEKEAENLATNGVEWWGEINANEFPWNRKDGE